jgi:ABC-2 type transport system ATP-binding protein
MAKEVISVSNLTKIYRKRIGSLRQRLFKPQWQEMKAVDGIAFSVRGGEAVAFLGPNGAGKTTTTKMLTGLIYPTAGTVDVLGYNPTARKRDFLCSIGLVMGNKAGLNWDLTARQSFDLIQKMYEIPPDKYARRLRHYTDVLNVQDKLDTQVRRLSLGERMKLELIGAILHAPQVLFLDEPTIGLDIDSKQALRVFLKRLHKEDGVTLLLTSHDMDDVAAVCERVLVINHGRIVHDGELAELTGRYRQERFLRLQLHSGAHPHVIRKYGEILESNPEHTNYLLSVSQKDLPTVLAKVTAALPIVDITIETAPLEQIISDVYHAPAEGAGA